MQREQAGDKGCMEEVEKELSGQTPFFQSTRSTCQCLQSKYIVVCVPLN